MINVTQGGKGNKGDEDEEGSISANDISLTDIKEKMEATLLSLNKELSAFRVGKASPGILP